MAASDQPLASAPTSDAPTPQTAADGIQTADQTPTASSEAVTPPTPPTPKPVSLDSYLRLCRSFDAILIALVLLFAFSSALFVVRNSDVLFHFAVGRLVTQGQYSFGPDPFSFASTDAVWVNHSWLFDVLSYGLLLIPDFGGVALVVVKALMIALLAELMLRSSRDAAGQPLWIPCVAVFLSVFAMSPRLFLQPVVVSYLFLGLTLYLLTRPAAVQKPTWDPRWLIPAVCALWVNLDAWFFLGPLLTACYLVGELLEPAGKRKSVGVLALVLVAAVAAALLNPYHIRAWTLPDSLGLSDAARVVKSDATFFTPFSAGHFGPNGAGRSAGGLAYYVVALLGVVSFVLNPSALTSWRAPVWVVFFALSAVHARAVPFFAVVAGPIAALNLLNWDEKRAAVVDLRAVRLVLFGRILSTVVGVLILAAGCLGYLQAQSTAERRLGAGLDLDPGLQAAAEQLGRWRTTDLLPAGEPIFNTTSEFAPYLAFYAPGLRSFIDQRLSVFDAKAMADARALRLALASKVEAEPGQDGKPPEPEDVWREVLKRRAGRFVVVIEPDLTRSDSVTFLRLFSSQPEWTPCYLDGRCALFAWADPDAPREQPLAEGLRWSAPRRAFGPDAEKAPDKRPAELEDEPWWSALWGREGGHNSETNAASLRMLELKGEQRVASQIGWASTAVRLVGTNISQDPLTGGGLFAWTHIGDAAEIETREFLFQHNEDVTAKLYLVVRAARRALALNPADERAYLRLGQAYATLLLNTNEQIRGYGGPLLEQIRTLQAVTALRKCVEIDPDNYEGHQALFRLFARNPRFFDLAVEHREAMARILEKRGGDPAEAGEEMKKMREALQLKINLFDSQTGGSKSPNAKVKAALELGLSKKAIDTLLEQKLDSLPAGADPRAVTDIIKNTITLLIESGRIAEARERINQAAGSRLLEQGGGLPTAIAPPAADAWFGAVVAASSGDYKEADEKLQVAIGVNTELLQRGDPSKMIGLSLSDLLLTKGVMAAGTPWPFAERLFQEQFKGQIWQQITQMGVQAITGRAELTVLRGALALEMGENAAAARWFEEALTTAGYRNGTPIPFGGAGLAEAAVGWIRDNSH